MKTRILLGALIASAMFCGQAYALDLFGGMKAAQSCAPCEPACAEPACEPSNPCDVCDPCVRPRCDLFSGLRGLFSCDRCVGPCDVGCETARACAPEPACEPVCQPEPECDVVCKPRPQPVRTLVKKARCALAPPCPSPCEVACEEPACETACRPRCRRRPVLNILNDLFGVGHKRCGVCSACVQPTECSACDAAVIVPGNGKDSEEPAPLPAAPNPDA